MSEPAPLRQTLLGQEKEAKMLGMSNDEVLTFNERVIADFRANDGVMPEGSPFHGNPTLLLTMIGAKSDRELVSPLSYAVDHNGDGEAWIVMASAGGSPKTPNWAFNLRAHPEVVVDLPGRNFHGMAAEAEGEERDRVYAVMTEQLPRFADYQTAVDRMIPLFRITRR